MDSNRSTPVHDSRGSPALQDRERSVNVESQRGPVKSIGEILNSEREGSAVSSAAGAANPLAGLSKADIAAMPIRPYLDQTVLPVLLEGMKQLAKEKYVRVPVPPYRIRPCSYDARQLALLT
ncbi:hypothetical protein BGZ98_000479 [Dissophora globulifera]|nr:hypothetical protein BGZ98_000479 [Dissophora globulifera]